MFLILLLLSSISVAYTECTYDVCSYHGICSTKGICVCDNDYTTDPSINSKQCNVEKHWFAKVFCNTFECNNVIPEHGFSFNGNCTNALCNYHGICNDDKTECICDSGYITYKSNNGTQCNYKQKNTVVAFCLSLFLFPVGAGEFYLENMGLGAGQLVYVFGFCILIAILTCVLGFTMKDTDGSVVIIPCFICLWSMGLIAWYIYDVVTIGKGNMTDGNGAPIPSL